MSCCHRWPDSVDFSTLLLTIYFSSTDTLICRREMSLIGSTSFGFAQNTIHVFQNTVLNSFGSVYGKCHKNNSLHGASPIWATGGDDK